MILSKKSYNFLKKDISIKNHLSSKENIRSDRNNDPTRQIAFDTVCQIFDWKHLPLETALKNALPVDVDQRDKAAAYRLIVCILRKKGTLEALVEPFLKRSPPQQVLWIILLGVAQILFLETPIHAAIYTSVELARHNGFAKFTGLVNAVLRRISENGPSILKDLDQNRLNIPAWLWKSWNQAGFNPRQLATLLDSEPPLDMHFKTNATVPEGGVQLMNNHWRYSCHVKVEQLDGYQEGQFWIQDIAASLPAYLLNVKENEKVADLCAAPGGKTAQLIQAGGNVVAVEKKSIRLKRLKENLNRLQMDAVLVLGDAGSLNYQNEFDAILLDAPCSATGIFRRHPDVLHLKKENEIQSLVKIQRKLIGAAISYLKKGGRLVYSVCSLQRSEAEEQAEFFRNLPGVRALPFTQKEIPFLTEALTEEGWIRTLPSMWQEKGGMDGFFIARFVKED